MGEKSGLAGTLDYYDKNAESYIEKTIGADMSEAYGRFLVNMVPGAKILDMGCGSGRDSLHFLQLGYDVTATDGSRELCRRASKIISKEVICIDFKDMEYSGEYDGVWACASLLHTPKSCMKEFIMKISRAMKRGGFSYLSFKYGDGERDCDGRHYSDYTEKDIPELLSGTGLECTDCWISGDVMGRENAWLNFIARKEN